MTVKELIEQEQAKHPGKEIGDDIALSIIWQKDDLELYFEDCREADGYCDYADLIDGEVLKFEYYENYGDLEGKLLLVIEVI